MANDERINHLLATLGEECGEVQQNVGKALRFGLFEHNPKTLKTHWVSMRNEVHDLVAVYMMVCDEIEVKADFDEDKLEAKIAKVDKYYKQLTHKE